MRKPRFLEDLKPLLPATSANEFSESHVKEAFLSVFTELVELLPGDSWARTAELLERYGMAKSGSAGASR
jgi:hypothetical protein